MGVDASKDPLRSAKARGPDGVWRLGRLFALKVEPPAGKGEEGLDRLLAADYRHHVSYHIYIYNEMQ